MKLKYLVTVALLFSVNLIFAQGTWQKPSIQWLYNFGANTGTGILNGEGFSTGNEGGSSVSTAPGTKGFMPYPPSGSVMLSNIGPEGAKPAGSAEWYLRDTLRAPSLKFVSSTAGRVAKLSFYDMANATSVSSFFYKISFENSTSKNTDWRFAVGQTKGGKNQLNNIGSGIPAKTSTNNFPYFFAVIRWAQASAGQNIPLTYCYRGGANEGEVPGTTYERELSGLNFSKGGTYNMELYCNNSSIEQSYVRKKTTHTIPANSYHIWANHTQLSDKGSVNIAGYQLKQNSTLDACMFMGSTSVPARSAVCYISDLSVSQVQNPGK